MHLSVRRRRTLVALAIGVAFAAPFTAAPARADEADALRTGLVQPVNLSLESEIDKLRLEQANPEGSQHRTAHKPSLPQGFSWNVDLSMAAPADDPKFNTNDPGGLDAGFGISLSRTNRIQAGYYEVQQVPLGFSNTVVPFYVQGLTGPGTTVPQSNQFQNTGLVNVTTKDKIFTAVDQNLFMLGKLPIVISPTYLSHTADVGGRGDLQTIEFDGFPTTVHTRTEQEYLLPVTVPVLASPKFFGTLTAAPQWLVHPAGINQTNHVQMFELAYVEYRANKATTFFFQPSRLITYDPDDAYPQHTPSFILGVSHHFTPLVYVQMLSIAGGPSNYNQLGITSLTCQRLPCAPSQVYPTIGGLKAAEFQVQLGLGSPTVIPL